MKATIFGDLFCLTCPIDTAFVANSHGVNGVDGKLPQTVFLGLNLVFVFLVVRRLQIKF